MVRINFCGDVESLSEDLAYFLFRISYSCSKVFGHHVLTANLFCGQASRSPVFRAMFEHELQEKTCAHIRVADVPTPAMRALLLYLYMGKGVPSSSRPFMGKRTFLVRHIFSLEFYVSDKNSNGDENSGVIGVVLGES